MDTSILGALSMIAPDLMRDIELRTLVLERVAVLGPIGRRALAQRLQLPEREVRSAADALRTSGCISQSAAGMELTDYGRSLVDTARAVSKGRRSLSAMELALARKLDVERVCIVRGDADVDESVLDEAAQAAAPEGEAGAAEEPKAEDAEAPAAPEAAGAKEASSSDNAGAPKGDDDRRSE